MSIIVGGICAFLSFITFKRKKIYLFSYNNKINNLEITYLDDFYKFNVDNNRYLEIKEMLES